MATAASLGDTARTCMSLGSGESPLNRNPQNPCLLKQLRRGLDCTVVRVHISTLHPLLVVCPHTGIPYPSLIFLRDNSSPDGVAKRTKYGYNISIVPGIII